MSSEPSIDVANSAPFAFRPKELAEMAENKSMEELVKIGGLEGLLKGLGTDPNIGLSGRAIGEGTSGGGRPFGASMEDRKRVYGINQIPGEKSKSLLQLMWLILLTVAAAASLALGLYQTLCTKETVPCTTLEEPEKSCPKPKVGILEGVTVVVAVLILVLPGSLNDWQKERRFRALTEKEESRTIKVHRDGEERLINLKEVVVGDLAILEPGDFVPCDGVFISGHNIKCDESGATGESDAVKKVTYEEALNDKDGKKDCFLLSGSKVQEGVCTYVVIAVGERSFNGRILMYLRQPMAATPLQEKLDNLSRQIAQFGGMCGIALLAATTIKLVIRSETEPNSTPNKIMALLRVPITLPMLLFALTLAITPALEFATERMKKEKRLVRVLDSCETMAAVCTDSTGTLTQNKMVVVAGSIGVYAKFVKNLKNNKNRSETEDAPGTDSANRKHARDFSIEQGEINKVLSPALRLAFNEAIAINSTAFEDIDNETGKIEFIGSKTETALLSFAKELEWPTYKKTRDAAEVVQFLPFTSERKYMGAMVKKGDKYRVYFKGASEILTSKCKYQVVVGTPDQPVSSSEDDPIEVKEIDELTAGNIADNIISYANQMLRTITLCYRDVDHWPPAGKSIDEVSLYELAHDMTLIGITGIEDPLRPTVRDAIADCGHTGVVVKMCTGDNVLTARSIAAQCGIYTPGGVIMEGPVFRRLTKAEREEVVPHLQVLARSSPDDKRALVETLMSMGEVVGVTGDGTNDGPALKEAKVGFSMGIAGTEVAKEASDIILMDDNFASIVSAIIWGRCVNDSVRKFLQFQISVNVYAGLITFLSSITSDTDSSILTAVQLLWINIIVNIFATLALAIDPATTRILDRRPDRRTAPPFTLEMIKMIFFQSMYQTFVVLLLHFAGPRRSGLGQEDVTLLNLVFDFIWCQVFNLINYRTIDRTIDETKSRIKRMKEDRTIRVNRELDEAIRSQKAAMDITPGDDESGKEERQKELERLLERRLQAVGGRKCALWSSLRASIAVPIVLGGARNFYELVKDKLFEDLQQLSTGIRRPKHRELFATIRRMENAILCLKLQDGDRLCQDIFKASTRLGVYCQALKHRARDATNQEELETLYKEFVRIEREFSAAHDRISSKYEQLYKQWKEDRQSISKFLSKADSTKSQSDYTELRALMGQVDTGFERMRTLLKNEANYLKNFSDTLNRLSKLVYLSPDPPIVSSDSGQIPPPVPDTPFTPSGVSKQVDDMVGTLSQVDALVEKSRYNKARKIISETLSKTIQRLKKLRTRSGDYDQESRTLSCLPSRQNDNSRDIWNRKLGLCNQLSNHVGEMGRMVKTIEKGFSGCKVSLQWLVFRPLGDLLCELRPYLPQAGLEVSSKGLHPDLILYEAALQAIADSIPAQSRLLDDFKDCLSVLDKLRGV